jgi:hypothetical protein
MFCSVTDTGVVHMLSGTRWVSYICLNGHVKFQYFTVGNTQTIFVYSEGEMYYLHYLSLSVLVHNSTRVSNNFEIQ